MPRGSKKGGSIGRTRGALPPLRGTKHSLCDSPLSAPVAVRGETGGGSRLRPNGNGNGNGHAKGLVCYVRGGQEGGWRVCMHACMPMGSGGRSKGKPIEHPKGCSPASLQMGGGQKGDRPNVGTVSGRCGNRTRGAGIRNLSVVMLVSRTITPIRLFGCGRVSSFVIVISPTKHPYLSGKYFRADCEVQPELAHSTTPRTC